MAPGSRKNPVDFGGNPDSVASGLGLRLMFYVIPGRTALRSGDRGPIHTVQNRAGYTWRLFNGNYRELLGLGRGTRSTKAYCACAQ